MAPERMKSFRDNNFDVLRLVIPLSWASWTWIEKPCLNLKTKIGRKPEWIPA
jgi:peptidoglycan/LPS O-acetylase OafA/YrhL